MPGAAIILRPQRYSAFILLLNFLCVLASAQTPTLDGRALMLDARKGNCASCHKIPGAPSAIGKSGVGPELAEIRTRYADQTQLRAAIWDLSGKMPNTVMPPYGKHRILTESEIDAIVRYLETL